MRLAYLLSQHRSGAGPATYALLALMCLQASRFESRMDEHNAIVLLPYQDRSTWNHALIQQGYYFLNLSSQGNELTIYHLESAIAAEHCLAPDFEATNWQRMLILYDLLLQQKQTPHVILNRAVVLAELQQAAAAIDQIMGIAGIDTLLKTQYIFSAVLGDLYAQCGDLVKARQLLEQALLLTPSIAEKNLIREKIDKTR